MLILAIDPGETTGLVLLSFKKGSVAVVGYKESELTFAAFVEALDDFMSRCTIHHVVVEDYRIYEGLGNMHTGRRLYTAELIGAIRALCSLSSIAVHILPAGKKGRWPDARLKQRMPNHKVTGVHATDALKLGLAFIEKELLWTL